MTCIRVTAIIDLCNMLEVFDSACVILNRTWLLLSCHNPTFEHLDIKEVWNGLER